MKSDLEGWRSWCKERAIITIIIFSFGTRQTKSSFPVRKLIEERRWNGGWLFTVSTCRGGGLWSHCTPIPGPLRYACSGWVVLKRLSVHFPTSFVSSPIRRWLSFRKKLLDFPLPRPAICQGTGSWIVGYTHPSSILSPTRDVASNQLLQCCADSQEQGICHFLFSRRLFNNKLLMGRDLEDIQSSSQYRMFSMWFFNI